MTGGTLRERVAFDALTQAPDGRGGHVETWTQVAERAAEFRYVRGREAVEGGALTGTATFKVRVRADAVTKALTTDHRVRDVRRNIAMNIREVDAITDRDSVWIVCDAGVAV